MDADIQLLTFLPPADDALACLSPSAARWHLAEVGAPTPVQRGGYPIIARGESALLSAPTGTGKTLAALLPLLERTPANSGIPSGIVGLVIAPLKALAADQVKNVAAVIERLRPDLRPGVRTGDTPPSQRRRDRDDPPQILWTTPESLAVLLTQDAFRRHIEPLRWVLVDEIHALAGNKRGADLSLSLERLETLTRVGPVQRVGLSATCEPLDEVARFLVGVGRRCRIVHVPPTTHFELRIEPLPRSPGVPPGFAARVVERLQAEFAVNRTTLIFANTRNVCERIGWALKRRLPRLADRVATHHSSLSAERRREIETKLKRGELTAVVASASLELGIDIGSVDGVVFVHPPGGVSRLLQRLGRARHRPDAVRRGLLLCSHASEILEAGVTAASGLDGQVEKLAIPDHPLDVLCQHLVGMGIGLAWSKPTALELIRRAYPYRHLSEDDLDACVAYLCGHSAEARDWLPARLDELGPLYSVTSRRTARLVVRNLGSIVDEEPRLIRLEADGPILGELDEHYANRLQPGDRFLLDGRCLTLVEAEPREFVVRETPGLPLVPSWGAAGVRVPECLARRMYLIRAEAAELARDGGQALERHLDRELGLGPAAAAELRDFLDEQESISQVPDGRTTLVEVVDRGFGFEYALHTPLHSPANEALARVLERRIVREFGGKAMTVAVTLGVVLFHECDMPLGESAWSTLLDPAGFHADADDILRAGDLTRARFAHVARIGLMVLRQPLGGPRKVGGRDWIERRLFDQIASVDPDFALLRQARRETLATTCQTASAERHLGERRPIVVRELGDVSPIAAAWLDAGEEAAHKRWHQACPAM